MITFYDNAFPDIGYLRGVVAKHNSLALDDQPYYTERQQQPIECEPLRLFFEMQAQFHYDRIIKTYNVIDANHKMHVNELTHAKYDVGQYIKPHMDGYNWGKGYRILTLLLYLHGEVEGGATVFPQQNITIYPKANRLVIFTTGIDTIHYTEPVISGCKEIVQAWAFYYLD